MIIITREEFEKAVHAAAACDETIYEAVLPYITRVWPEVQRLLLTQGEAALDSNTELSNLTKSYVCELGFIRALRHLDLVLTDSGFGVVHNDHVAPASAERVAKLEETLWQSADRDKCEMLRILFTLEGWGAETGSDSLLPALLWDRQMAQELIGTGEMTHNDWSSTCAALIDAETMLSMVVGDALISELRTAVRTDAASDIQREAIEKMQRAEAFLVRNANNDVKYKKTVKARVIVWFDEHKESFPAYTASKEYIARNSEDYENTANSPAYFF